MIGISKAIQKWAVARIGKLLLATTRFLLFGRDGSDREYYFGGKQITQFPKKKGPADAFRHQQDSFYNLSITSPKRL
ncbi:MAG: hypothetical protein IKN12_05035, partial [Selenomonadaceae bacterium]|nr:hypothetical protein [Selenomonadaceae bacterium]